MPNDPAPQTPPRIIPVPAFADWWGGKIEPIAKRIITAWNGPEKFAEPLVMTGLRRFARWAFLMPGSACYHDVQPGGLVEHSYRVALKSLANAPAYWTWEDRLALIMLAIIHDAPRAWRVDIGCTDKANIPSYDVLWEPHHDSMTSWVERVRQRNITLVWRARRPRHGPESIESLGVTMVTRFFNEACPPFVGRRRMNALIWATTRSLPRPTIDYYTPFRNADMADAGGALRVQIPNATPAERFLAGLRQVIEERDVPINHDDEGDIFVSGSHLLLAAEGSHGAFTWRCIADALVEDHSQDTSALRGAISGANYWVGWDSSHPLRRLYEVRLSTGRAFQAAILPLATLKTGATYPSYEEPLALLRAGSLTPVDPTAFGFRPLQLVTAIAHQAAPPVHPTQQQVVMPPATAHGVPQGLIASAQPAHAVSTASAMPSSTSSQPSTPVRVPGPHQPSPRPRPQADADNDMQTTNRRRFRWVSISFLALTTGNTLAPEDAVLREIATRVVRGKTQDLTTAQFDTLLQRVSEIVRNEQPEEEWQPDCSAAGF